jgi:hypothetical protein
MLSIHQQLLVAKPAVAAQRDYQRGFPAEPGQDGKPIT